MRLLVLIDDPIIRNVFQKIIKDKIKTDINVDYRVSYYEKTEETKVLNI